jgi:DedD protein
VERPVKERLIGAAVLMAAAIILIPEMLSGPDRDPADKQARAATDGEGAGEASIKTYTIDLSQSPGAQSSIASEPTNNSAPPPEEMPSAAPVPAEQPTTTPQVSPESEPAPPPAVVAETPKPEPARAEAPPPSPKPEPKSEPPKPEPRAIASAPAAPRSAVPAGKGWAVQLGSYSSETTAQRLMNEWRAKGQDAFVMPVTTGGKTLYRVRIGPSKDRAGADAALKAVKASIPSAAVVAHP